MQQRLTYFYPVAGPTLVCTMLLSFKHNCISISKSTGYITIENETINFSCFDSFYLCLHLHVFGTQGSSAAISSSKEHSEH